MNHDALVAEMRALRDQVVGITDTVVAAVDGLLIAADTEDAIDPNGLAALAAASLGLSQRIASAALRGSLRRTVTCSSGGYTAVYAVDDTALLIVVGDEGMNVPQLHVEARTAIERIASILLQPEPGPASVVEPVPDHEGVLG
ncbi:roadblock/LC7 domain-containing protein [Streptomyces sp. NPDC088354]|uniref:roadblock/LC7 domain-containing protein n=1 Tax=unclassified Streptomyces TaxID=2593676 RepID=UPI0029B09E8F|nr:roadblock/LC7 domain-containing protein [Streptomyces sp. MI02-7b]MDX3072240.1 roadblock/LC7 domain-containing protein [Streptomyces sp. MI02-7b]